MPPDQPFMSKWLSRLRKDLIRSGSLTELSLHLNKHSDSNTTPEQWQQTIRAIIDEKEKPDSTFVLAVDQWISQRNQSTPNKTTPKDDQLDLL